MASATPAPAASATTATVVIASGRRPDRPGATAGRPRRRASRRASRGLARPPRRRRASRDLARPPGRRASPGPVRPPGRRASHHRLATWRRAVPQDLKSPATSGARLLVVIVNPSRAPAGIRVSHLRLRRGYTAAGADLGGDVVQPPRNRGLGRTDPAPADRRRPARCASPRVPAGGSGVANPSSRIGEQMFFATYLRRELRRRMRQAIFVALGLAVGIGLVVTVSAASAGVKKAESSVLASLYGVGTDVTVTGEAPQAKKRSANGQPPKGGTTIQGGPNGATICQDGKC